MIIPFAWAIMSKKTKNLYRKTFELIKEHIAPQMSPTNFMTDYEVALYSSIKDVFPQCENNGCYFHLVYAIRKKLRKLGIRREIEALDVENSKILKMLIRKFINLCFLPAQFIERAFIDLCEEAEKNENIFDVISPFIVYFRRQWIVKTSPEVFSMFRTVDRTNNGQERYHRYLKDLIGINPPVHKFFCKYIILRIRIVCIPVRSNQRDCIVMHMHIKR
ncbi:uncharacterized protein [Prorops nasuta]|uniref:uncharacterized protein n=1 Tax=Prorops nasuta TaxID=863751 RepID=UPI0034CEEBEB